MKRALLVVLLAGGFAMPLQAGSKAFSPFVPIVNDTAVSDTGRWEIQQDNMGRFVIPLRNYSGGYWPKHSGQNYLYGAGIWVGVVDTTRTPADTQVTYGYDPAYGNSSFAPSMPNGDTAGAITDSLARVYRSDLPRDTAQWPERDSLGRMIVASDQELWAIFNDVNPIYMRTGDTSIGLQVIRRSYAWNSPGPWGDIVKIEHEVKNVTGRWMGNPHTLRHVILGLGVDADIGAESAGTGNDLCYLDRTSGSPYPNLAVQYQTVQEYGWGPPPYYVGMKLVAGPVNNTGDTLRIRSQPGIGYTQYDHDVLPGQPLGMTAFQIFFGGIDPIRAGERYLELTGRNWRTPTVYNAYMRDIFGPTDKRFLFSCGPFDLPDDSSVTLVVHIIGGTDSLDILHKAELVGVESPPGHVSQAVSTIMLYPVTPNPSSGSALIRYALPKPSSVLLKVYDVAGRLVRELDRGERPAGVHSKLWDGRDGKGKSLGSGVFFVRLESVGLSKSEKMVILR